MWCRPRRCSRARSRHGRSPGPDRPCRPSRRTMPARSPAASLVWRRGSCAAIAPPRRVHPRSPPAPTHQPWMLRGCSRAGRRLRRCRPPGVTARSRPRTGAPAAPGSPGSTDAAGAVLPCRGESAPGRRGAGGSPRHRLSIGLLYCGPALSVAHIWGLWGRMLAGQSGQDYRQEREHGDSVAQAVDRHPDVDVPPPQTTYTIGSSARIRPRSCQGVKK